ncbi:SpoIIE family protein phosphatase [Streptomyces sp. NPDC086787]|uniref:SpoIIE family protein phosphatase n=1 Tax=Streptomyces sp. NPDC086787 TaxID=3365759 RepID=UPI00381AE239
MGTISRAVTTRVVAVTTSLTARLRVASARFVPRSIAGEVLLMTMVVITLLVVAVACVLMLQNRELNTERSRARTLAIAETIASTPAVRRALLSADPSESLQPIAEEVSRRNSVTSVTVMDAEGTRFTHPDKSLVGTRYSGAVEPALAGETFTETGVGAYGPVVRTVAPIEVEGEIAGLVSVAVTTEEAARAFRHDLPELTGLTAGALLLGTGGAKLVQCRLRARTHGLGPIEITKLYEHHDAMLHAVREGIVIVDRQGKVVLINDEGQRLLGLSGHGEGQELRSLGLPATIAELVGSGRCVRDQVAIAGDRLLVINQQVAVSEDRVLGTVATLRDSTDLLHLVNRSEAAQRNLSLLHEASHTVGNSLDLTQTAKELACATVPDLADFIDIEVRSSLVSGDDAALGEMRRTVAFDHEWEHPVASGESVDRGDSRVLAHVGETRKPFLAASTDVDLAADPWLSRDLGRRSDRYFLLVIPLVSQETLIGTATFTRAERFKPEDVTLLEHICRRAAVCLNNAAQYAREQATSLALQRSLLPQSLPRQQAVEGASLYLPAHSGVGGDWFDVIPISGARVGLVVGDVTGHGLHAAVTMGRLRTAVHNFASLDLPPDELLLRLDDLVSRIDSEMDPASNRAVVGATCVYAVYDPLTRQCAMASAGHLPPALMDPAGDVRFLDVPVNPPLGMWMGAAPMDTVDFTVAEGSHIVLYTDGLVESREEPIEAGLDRLAAVLAGSRPSPAEICESVRSALVSESPTDDIAVLVARTSALGADRVSSWDLPSEPAALSGLRAAVREQLTSWGLEETVTVSELVVSELATNAVRYGRDPISVKLIRNGDSLICEVADASPTSPHLRYARSSEEGGRGLFLVSQLVDRWGTRYGGEGKVIWTEQSLVP